MTDTTESTKRKIKLFYFLGKFYGATFSVWTIWHLEKLSGDRRGRRQNVEILNRTFWRPLDLSTERQGRGIPFSPFIGHFSPKIGVLVPPGAEPPVWSFSCRRSRASPRKGGWSAGLKEGVSSKKGKGKEGAARIGQKFVVSSVALLYRTIRVKVENCGFLFLPGPFDPPWSSRPSRNMTARSYSWTTWDFFKWKIIKSTKKSGKGCVLPYLEAHE